jgi:hypothetical protein
VRNRDDLIHLLDDLATQAGAFTADEHRDLAPQICLMERPPTLRRRTDQFDSCSSQIVEHTRHFHLCNRQAKQRASRRADHLRV